MPPGTYHVAAAWNKRRASGARRWRGRGGRRRRGAARLGAGRPGGGARGVPLHAQVAVKSSTPCHRCRGDPERPAALGHHPRAGLPLYSWWARRSSRPRAAGVGLRRGPLCSRPGAWRSSLCSTCWRGNWASVGLAAAGAAAAGLTMSLWVDASVAEVHDGARPPLRPALYGTGRDPPRIVAAPPTAWCTSARRSFAPAIPSSCLAPAPEALRTAPARRGALRAAGLPLPPPAGRMGAPDLWRGGEWTASGLALDSKVSKVVKVPGRRRWLERLRTVALPSTTTCGCRASPGSRAGSGRPQWRSAGDSAAPLL